MPRAPAAAVQVVQDCLGHELSAKVVDGQPTRAVIAHDAGGHLAKGHAQIEWDAVAVTHDYDRAVERNTN